MRLLALSDLHYNNPKSRLLTDELIDRVNGLFPDVLLVVGDTAAADGSSLEECLARFSFTGPKLFVAGNHELWTAGPDSYSLLTEQLPRRIANAGWHWLQTQPFIAGDIAIVGSIGWYDYSFAREQLQIPKRFYQNKISPGAARRFSEFAHLFQPQSDIGPQGLEAVARWNDGRHVKLQRSDEEFLELLLQQLEGQLQSLRHIPTIIAAVHHLPFRQLLPPPHGAQWDFAKAFLGSGRIGEILLKYPNVRYCLCGHSHMPVEMDIGHMEVINIGSGYRWKTYRELLL